MRVLPVLALAWGCDPGPISGQHELFRVREGTYRQGSIPEDPDAATPRVPNVGGVGSIAMAGQNGVPFSGFATPDGLSVLVALDGFDEGYWVVPLGPPDVTQEGQLGFEIQVEFGSDIVPGRYQLVFVAVDAEGNPGPRATAAVCVLPDQAHGALTVCDAEFQPQHTVLSLSWAQDADLDLVVVAPSGKIVRAKTPSTGLSVGLTVPNEVVADPSTGVLSRDSNGGCVIDGIRRESLIFREAPEPGEYAVYASLHATCGTQGVDWTFSSWLRSDDPSGPAVIREDLGAGSLLPVHADGGVTLGTYVTTVIVP